MVGNDLKSNSELSLWVLREMFQKKKKPLMFVKKIIATNTKINLVYRIKVQYT